MINVKIQKSFREGAFTMHIKDLFPVWARQALGRAMRQPSADFAATVYVDTMLPQHVKAEQYELAAQTLLEFLEQGQCSQGMQERLAEWVNIMARKINAEGESAAAQKIIWRLGRFRTGNTGPSGAWPYPQSSHE